jgi:hypothetical protein
MMSVGSLSGPLAFLVLSKHEISTSLCQYSSLMQNIYKNP